MERLLKEKTALTRLQQSHFSFKRQQELAVSAAISTVMLPSCLM
jgi:hypothetical protein